MIFFLLQLLSALLAAAAPAPAAAAPASWDDLVAARDGRWTFVYATRAGVEGDCRSVSVRDRADDGGTRVRGHWPGRDLAPGPARVTLRLGEGRLAACDLQVGDCASSAPEGVRDLGEVPPGRAARWLLDRARRARGDAADAAVTAAAVARTADLAAPLVALARAPEAAQGARRAALHWLAVLAAETAMDAAAGLLDDAGEELALREHAVFALAQLEQDRACELLLGVARSHPDPRLRRAAIFALAQHDDPRVLRLFEDILLGD